ncbi:hypothetical protein, partial [Silvania hatchlandensis]
SGSSQFSYSQMGVSLLRRLLIKWEQLTVALMVTDSAPVSVSPSNKSCAMARARTAADTGKPQTIAL